MNLYKDLPTFADEQNGVLNMVIDIAKNETTKYEYDEEGGYFKLDRVLHHSMFYPFNYGFIPQTTEPDGDATDVILLSTHPVMSGAVVKVRLIGLLDTSDEEGNDPKLVAVPISKVDPRRDEYQKIEDIPQHIRQEIKTFFKEYKRLEKGKYDKITIGEYKNKEDAYADIKEAQVRYQKKHA